MTRSVVGANERGSAGGGGGGQPAPGGRRGGAPWLQGTVNEEGAVVAVEIDENVGQDSDEPVRPSLLTPRLFPEPALRALMGVYMALTASVAAFTI